MPALAFTRLDTPLGPMLLAGSDRGLVASSQLELAAFLADLSRRFPHAEVVPDPAPLADAAAWLTAYLEGRRRDLVRVDLSGLSAFDAAVYEVVRSIPYGSTATYGDVAAAIGLPRAARAVGGAMARCPLFPAVPCHRVVRASDGISGWGSASLAVKRRLLAMESRAGAFPITSSSMDG
jgi:methylated-DNA-[protein]-cysteine S-methyltransferase